MSNQVLTDLADYAHGSYRRIGSYLDFICKGNVLRLPEGFHYNVSDSYIYEKSGNIYGKIAVVGWESEVKVFETKENPVSKFKLGQKVYCVMNGLGEVSFSSSMGLYSVTVSFKHLEQVYTGSGQFSAGDVNPTLLTLEEAKAKGYDVPKQKIVKEKTVYINLYGNGERSYLHDTEEDAKYNARTKDANLLSAAYPVTIKYEIEE